MVDGGIRWCRLIWPMACLSTPRHRKSPFICRKSTASQATTAVIDTYRSIPKVPAGTSKPQLIETINATAHTYEVRKYYRIARDGGSLVGIYFWESVATANAFYTPVGIAMLTKRWAGPPQHQEWETPMVVESAERRLVAASMTLKTYFKASTTIGLAVPASLQILGARVIAPSAKEEYIWRPLDDRLWPLAHVWSTRRFACRFAARVSTFAVGSYRCPCAAIPTLG
jgi:hypothetical protein